MALVEPFWMVSEEKESWAWGILVHFSSLLLKDGVIM
jgi:hypothetical protein